MAAENYTNTFGGENINPANLSYVAYTVSSNLKLVWAFEAIEGDSPTADKIDISNTTVPAGLTVMMPAANQVSVGQDVLFGNVGSYPYTVVDQGGNTICTVASGLEWYIWVSDNSTVNGTWRTVQYGASSSVANAAALAGAGLRANVTRLDQNLTTTPLTGSYSISAADRATVLENNGGSVTYTLPDATVVGNGWFVYIINEGSGNLTLDPPGIQIIDGAPTKTLAPAESLIVFGDGNNYHTLGYGRSLVNTVTGQAINAAGSGTLVLTPTQVAAQVQDFSGTLTGARVIQYGSGVGYWFVYNNTTGGFTFTAQAGAGDPGVVVPATAFSILRSNGTNMEVAFSGAVGTVTSVGVSSDLIGGPITTTGTLGLSSTGVTAATYGAVGPPITVPSLAIDVKGRITNATSITLGTSAGLPAGSAPGNVPLLDAGGNVPSLNGGLQPGDVVYSIAASKPGFVFANGSTIGNAASGATQRANADTVNLYAVLWALSTTAVSGGRGGSATLDFNANKTITTIDLRGTVIAGLDNAGGAASAGRLSGIFASTTMGGAIGNTAIQSTTVGFSSSGVNNINFGTIGAGLYGYDFRVTGESGGGLQFGGSGAFVQAGDAVGIYAIDMRTTINANFNIGVSGSGTTAGFGIAQSTMVMNPFLKL